jgi:hypothetical protein
LKRSGRRARAENVALQHAGDVYEPTDAPLRRPARKIGSGPRWLTTSPYFCQNALAMAVIMDCESMIANTKRRAKSGPFATNMTQDSI